MSRKLPKRRKRPLSRWEYGQTRFTGASIVPELLLILCTVVMIWFCRRFLLEAEQHDLGLVTLLPMVGALLGIVLVAGMLVFSQASRSLHRLSGPTHLIIVAMQRTRTGDLGHRVHLRRGDKLTEIAAEFNRVLDWLNENPPVGARTGTDMIEVDHAADRFQGLDVDDGPVDRTAPTPDPMFADEEEWVDIEPGAGAEIEIDIEVSDEQA